MLNFKLLKDHEYSFWIVCSDNSGRKENVRDTIVIVLILTNYVKIFHDHIYAMAKNK